MPTHLAPSTAQLLYRLTKSISHTAPQDKHPGVPADNIPGVLSPTLKTYYETRSMLHTKRNGDIPGFQREQAAKYRHKDNNNKLEFGDCCRIRYKQKSIHSTRQGEGGSWERHGGDAQVYSLPVLGCRGYVLPYGLVLIIWRGEDC